MPPKKKKDGGSKKADQKKKNKLIEDKTFGLKNKNKSKKVQSHIHAMTSSVMNSGDRKQRKADHDRKQAAIARKMRKKAAEEERNALFGEALLAVKKKTSTKMKGENEAKGRDHDDSKAKSGTSRAMKMMFQMDAQEMEEALTQDPNYVRTLEDEVELQRQQKLNELKAKGSKGTPITPETFKAWQEKKRKAKLDAAKKLVEAEMKKKKGGKGLSVLSGRDLFAYKRDLFKDDEDANDVLKMLAEDDANGVSDDSKNPVGGDKKEGDVLEDIAEKVQTDLFLDGDDEDLDDLDDLED